MAFFNGKKVFFSPKFTLGKEEQSKTVALSMASGNQTVSPDSGKVLSGVTITKPETLLPENVKKDIVIGGVTGTYEGGGSIEWNIAYGHTAPTDTTKLWIYNPNVSSVKIQSDYNGSHALDKITDITGLTYSAVGTDGTDVYIFGGFDGEEGTTTISKLDTATDTLTTLSAVMPAKIGGACCATLNNYIYIIGGSEYLADDTYYNTIYVFDPQTGSISTSSITLPNGIRFACCAYSNGSVYIFGGATVASEAPYYEASTAIYKLTGTNVSTLTETLSEKRMMAGCCELNDKIYIIGGIDEYENIWDSIEVFDTSTETISAFPEDLPIVLGGACCSPVDDEYICVFGGATYSEMDTPVTNYKIYYIDTMDGYHIEELSTHLIEANSSAEAVLIIDKIYLVCSNALYRFGYEKELTEDSIVIQTDGEYPFDIVQGKVRVNIGTIIKGHSGNIAEDEQAFLYKNGEWVQINPYAE